MVVAHIVGLLSVAMFVTLALLLADRPLHWLLFAVGVVIGIPIGTWSTRNPLLQSSAAGQWALVIAVVAAFLLPDVGMLLVAGAGIPVVAIGVRRAWPWRATLQRWGTWRG